MITPFINLFQNQYIISPTILTGGALAIAGKAIVEMKPYWEGFVKNIFESPVEEYPLCNFSTKRIKVIPNTIGSDLFRKFINGNEVEMSCDKEGIAQLVKDIHKANYTLEMLSNLNLPYLALAAFAKDLISILDLSNVLLWHQLINDYPDLDLVVLPLFDELGSWTPEAKSLFKTNDYKDFELMRIEMQKLPLSQQVFRKINSKSDKFKNRDYGFVPSRELSIEANRIEHFFYYSYHHFGTEPRLGTFSKEDILKAEIENKSRLYHIPFPGIETGPTLGSAKVSPSEFAGHDRRHWEIMHYLCPEIIEALLEIVISFRKTTEKQMSEEIWRVADFAFPSYPKRHLKEEINTVFNRAMRDIRFYESESLWRWFSVLHMRANRQGWLTDYGISIDNISELSDKNRLINLAEPFIINYSILEQIYFLQKLDYKSVQTSDEIKAFFEAQLTVPLLTTIEHVDQYGNRDLRLKIKDN